MLAEKEQLDAMPAPAERVLRSGSSPVIQGWAIVGYDRIVGLLRGRAGEGGKAIMTSPVLRISFVGSRRTPVALTQSGSVYALGTPAESFGAQRAEHFLLYKCGALEAPKQGPAPRLPTSLMKIEP